MRYGAVAFERAFVPATGLDLIEDVTVGDVLRQAARDASDLTALKEGAGPGRAPRRWTYAELLADAERVARALLESVDPGEKVAIWANNAPEWVLVQMGAALAGVTLVTVNPALRREEVNHVLGHSEAAVVIHLARYRQFDMAGCLRALQPQLPALRETIPLSEWEAFCGRASDSIALPAVRPDDLAQIQYTSGTTGLPKGAVLRHRGIVNSARFAMRRKLKLSAGDCVVNSMPLFHTAGSVFNVLGCLQARAAHVLMPNFDPGLQLALIDSERSSIFGGVPTMLRAMLEHNAFNTTDLSSVTSAVSGGALVEPALAREVQSKLGVPLSIIYGQTETCGLITMTGCDDSPDDQRNTVGRAFPGIEVRIVDPGDRSTVMSIGQVGEICTRGYHVMAGYHNDPEQTANVVDEDGWLHTGDLASMDDRGYFRIEGRLKDMIIRGGENIYPSEVETALVEHAAIAESAVVGIPDQYWGEQVVAFVRLAPGGTSTADELQSFLGQRLAPHKVPKGWHFVEAFPMNASGKILKTALRKQATQDAGA
jgi:fatty-acyl-CoA synthase